MRVREEERGGESLATPARAPRGLGGAHRWAARHPDITGGTEMMQGKRPAASGTAKGCVSEKQRFWLENRDLLQQHRSVSGGCVPSCGSEGDLVVRQLVQVLLGEEAHLTLLRGTATARITSCATHHQHASLVARAWSRLSSARRRRSVTYLQ